MEKIIVANHKMNMDFEEIKKYITKLKTINNDIIVCPTSVYAPYFIENGFNTGLQNIYFENDGPYTGEISAKQAKSLGIEYVIIGHSERRQLFNETNEIINKKVKSALANKLKVILCVGESTEQRKDYEKVLNKQITNCLKDIKEEVIIAYEPIWAIGTGMTPISEEINEIIKYIKSLFDYDVKVLYGGSVNSKNIKAKNEVNVVSGYLIGGASTQIDELLAIREVVK